MSASKSNPANWSFFGPTVPADDTLKMLAGLLYPTSGTAKVRLHAWNVPMLSPPVRALARSEKSIMVDLPARESLS